MAILLCILGILNFSFISSMISSSIGMTYLSSINPVLKIESPLLFNSLLYNLIHECFLIWDIFILFLGLIFNKPYIKSRPCFETCDGIEYFPLIIFL